MAFYVRHEEGKKRKELPALRKKFVKAVDASAEKNLQELLDKCVKEAEKYRQMK